jgi:hypothetical protein
MRSLLFMDDVGGHAFAPRSCMQIRLTIIDVVARAYDSGGSFHVLLGEASRATSAWGAIDGWLSEPLRGSHGIVVFRFGMNSATIYMPH